MRRYLGYRSLQKQFSQTSTFLMQPVWRWHLLTQVGHVQTLFEDKEEQREAPLQEESAPHLSVMSQRLFEEIPAPKRQAV